MDPRQLRDLVVRPSLAALSLPGGEAAERLVMGTAAHESGGFRYIKQVGGGPALSLWQIEPATADDAVRRCSMRDFVRIEGIGPIVTGQDWGAVLPGNLYLGAALCRLIYHLKPFEMPTDGDLTHVPVGDLAAIWKRWWNTEEGAGHPEQFVQAYRAYVFPLYGY